MDYMNNKEALAEFGRNLSMLRKNQKITQEQLAEMIDKSTEFISFLERGERSPSFETILDLAKALGVRIGDLMNLDSSERGNGTLEKLAVDPINSPVDEPIEEPIKAKENRRTDLERLNGALAGVGDLQALASEYGIHDIFQDNGAKVLQMAIILGLRVSPGREGNDAVDADGKEYELKTVNVSGRSNPGITTHHHLNHDILDKYRKVKSWFIGIYEGIRLQKIYQVDTALLEPLFQKWEIRISIDEGKPLNNPKIPMKLVQKGTLVYPEHITN